MPRWEMTISIGEGALDIISSKLGTRESMQHVDSILEYHYSQSCLSNAWIMQVDSTGCNNSGVVIVESLMSKMKAVVNIAISSLVPTSIR